MSKSLFGIKIRYPKCQIDTLDREENDCWKLLKLHRMTNPK